MPWEQVTVQQSRQEFVLLALQADANISALCARFGISRKTGYKWLGRFAQGAGLQECSRRPRSSPHKSADGLEQAVVQLRQRHPAWGGRKIAHVLARDQQLHVAPSTVTNILHRHGLVTPAASQAATPWQRFEHEEPNSLWQMDFKGHFGVGVGAQRCHPLTVIDDHSRFNLALQACRNEQRQTVQAVLQQVFERYGLPRRINADNGSPWGTAGQGPLSGLGVWLIRLGVRLSHSRALHPQTNGKDERFHRTLKAEVLHQQHFADFECVQPQFDRWRQIYNCERPHQALHMQTPVQRYRPSNVRMPRTLPPVEYGPDDLVRKVQQGGYFHLHGREIKTSKALIGQPIALRPVSGADGSYDIYFCHQYVDSIALGHTDDL